MSDDEAFVELADAGGGDTDNCGGALDTIDAVGGAGAGAGDTFGEGFGPGADETPTLPGLDLLADMIGSQLNVIVVSSRSN